MSASLIRALISSAAAFDASADAQVLQTMLAREGLTESDFVREKSV